MVKTSQSGFSAVEALLILVIIGILGFTGYFVYHAKQNTDKTLANTGDNSSVQSQKTSTQAIESDTDNTSSYLMIKEWNLKLAMADADKVTYEYSTNSGEGDSGQTDSNILLMVKPELLQNKDCEISVGMTRYTTINSSLPADFARKIGNYYFTDGGSPYSCENDADNQLMTKIRQEFTVDKLESN